jgi:6-phosphofructokinase 1
MLTGGGDAPGLNAAVRAVARRGFQYGYEVFGIHNGWLGLVEDEVEEFSQYSVSGILHTGGTILGATRTNVFAIPDGVEKIQSTIKKHGLDAIVVIGGIDTLGVAQKLYQNHDIPLVGIPKTIDNNVPGTDQCIGFNSAVATVAEALDKLHTTASAHSRVIVVEVMGRDAGWLATVGGLAGGADYIIVPEVPTTVAEVCDHLKRRAALDKHHSIIVVAEGATLSDLEESLPPGPPDAFGRPRMDYRGVGEAVARAIELCSNFEARVVVIGHLQRGGAPTVFDRVLATRMGVLAVDLVREGRFGQMTALHGNKLEPVTLSVLKAGVRQVNVDLYRLAQVFF